MVKTVQSNMTPDQFRKWRARHGLTQDQAALALGLSRRSVGSYERGDQPISESMRLATLGIDLERLKFDPKTAKAIRRNILDPRNQLGKIASNPKVIRFLMKNLHRLI